MDGLGVFDSCFAYLLYFYLIAAWDAARGLSRAGLTGVLRARKRDMDFNEYTALMLVRERHAEMVAAARREALLKEYTRGRRTFRAALGTVLIRVGARLLREHYPAAAAR
jgi:hypothetical protein